MNKKLHVFMIYFFVFVGLPVLASAYMGVRAAYRWKGDYDFFGEFIKSVYLTSTIAPFIGFAPVWLLTRWMRDGICRYAFKQWLFPLFVSTILATVYFEFVFWSMIKYRMMSGDSNFGFLIPILAIPMVAVEILVLFVAHRLVVKYCTA